MAGNHDHFCRTTDLFAGSIGREMRQSHRENFSMREFVRAPGSLDKGWWLHPDGTLYEFRHDGRFYTEDGQRVRGGWQDIHKAMFDGGQFLGPNGDGVYGGLRDVSSLDAELDLLDGEVGDFDSPEDGTSSRMARAMAAFQAAREARRQDNNARFGVLGMLGTAAVATAVARRATRDGGVISDRREEKAGDLAREILQELGQGDEQKARRLAARLLKLKARALRGDPDWDPEGPADLVLKWYQSGQSWAEWSKSHDWARRRSRQLARPGARPQPPPPSDRRSMDIPRPRFDRPGPPDVRRPRVEVPRVDRKDRPRPDREQPRVDLPDLDLRARFERDRKDTTPGVATRKGTSTPGVATRKGTSTPVVATRKGTSTPGVATRKEGRPGVPNPKSSVDRVPGGLDLGGRVRKDPGSSGGNTSVLRKGFKPEIAKGATDRFKDRFGLEIPRMARPSFEMDADLSSIEASLDVEAMDELDGLELDLAEFDLAECIEDDVLLGESLGE